jgi:hypothetical protein
MFSELRCATRKVATGIPANLDEAPARCRRRGSFIASRVRAVLCHPFAGLGSGHRAVIANPTAIPSEISMNR